MANNVKPLSDRVLVQPLEEQEVKKGGIIIPDTAREKPQEGTVVAVGTGKLELIACTANLCYKLKQALAMTEKALEYYLFINVIICDEVDTYSTSCVPLLPEIHSRH